MRGRKKKSGSKSKTSRAKEDVEPPAAPLQELPTECHDPYLLLDDEDWLLFMDPAFCENPGLARTFAQLLFRIKEAVESEPEKFKRVGFTLSDGIRMAYKYTEEHQLAFRLFTLYLEGRLKVQDEPLQLLKAAIARADVEKGRRSKMLKGRGGNARDPGRGR